MSLAGFKEGDILQPKITITQQETERMKSDITILSGRKDRLCMAVRDVVKAYSHTHIDERFVSVIMHMRTLEHTYTPHCENKPNSKLLWPISKIRECVKKYEVYQ